LIIVVKDSFEGSSNIIKTYQEDMIGFKITNDHDTTKLSFTIHSITISVKPLETFSGKFAPYRSVTINTTVPYRATLSAPFDGTITPPPPDTTAPNEVTNLSASNVTATSLVLSWTASSSNDVSGYDIYKDGSFLISVANTSFEVTGLTQITEYTFSVIAKDGANNESSRMDVIITTTGIITDGLILHYDFTNKAGTSSNTITDTVNNVEATLIGVAHDGVNDGYIDNRGLLLQPSEYVTVPTNTSPVNNMIDINSGLTIELTSYDTNGILFRTANDKLRMFLNANVNLWGANYLATDGTIKTTSLTVSQVIKPLVGNIAINNALNNKGSNAINTITLRKNQGHTMNIFINGLTNYQQHVLPTDFVSFVNTLAEMSLHLRRNIVGLNTGPTILRNFSIYNRALTDQEITQNYTYHNSNETLQSVSVHPSEVNLQPGHNQILSAVGSPSKYTNLLTTTFQSGNEGFVTVDENGILTGVHEGETVITVTSTYEEHTFTNYVNVTVEGQTLTPPSSTRTIDGMSINRSIDTLEVGESYAVMATALSSELPYDIFNDNIVLWESSDTTIAKVNYGVLEGVSQGTATLTAYDSMKNYSESFDVTVTNPTEVIIKAGETFNVSLNDYAIKSDNTNSTNTTTGIQSALDYASTNGFKKIVFPQGTYLVNPTVRTIQMPNEMIVDFSDSTINIEPSSLTAIGYTMILFSNVSNTKLINAKIYGEADFTSVQQSVESCVSVVVREECYKSGLENCTVSKSPGFNILTENKLVKTGTTGRNVNKDNFESGNIGAMGNVDNSINVNYYRSINYMDISGLGDYYMIGYNQGYYGYPHLRSRLYSIHFYNEVYEHIESQMYNLQFYNYDKPVNAKYAKLVIYQEAAPTTQDGDFNAVAFIRTVAMPRRCFIKNCIIEDNFSTGIALCGGEDWLIEGNTFSNNRGRMPGCDIDWEDGWENMIGDITTKNTFNTLSGVIFSAGGSLALFNNTFNNSNLVAWGRTQNYRIFNNVFNGRGSQDINLSTQGDSVFARNILTDGATFKTGINHTGASYKVHEIYNTIV
jgi:uncharacterized protein YjdB